MLALDSPSISLSLRIFIDLTHNIKYHTKEKEEERHPNLNQCY